MKDLGRTIGAPDLPQPDLVTAHLDLVSCLYCGEVLDGVSVIEAELEALDTLENPIGGVDWACPLCYRKFIGNDD